MRKFGFEERDGRDRWYWLTVEGRLVLRTRQSYGRKDPPKDLVRQQLRLNEDQLREGIACTLGRDGYLEILRGKGLLPG